MKFVSPDSPCREQTASALGVGGRCIFTGRTTHLLQEDGPKSGEGYVRMLPGYGLDAGIQGTYLYAHNSAVWSREIDKHDIHAQG